MEKPFPSTTTSVFSLALESILPKAEVATFSAARHGADFATNAFNSPRSVSCGCVAPHEPFER